jgi:hypothetical protein
LHVIVANLNLYLTHVFLQQKRGYMIEISVKWLKGGEGPNKLKFCQNWWRNQKSGCKKHKEKEEGTRLVFSPKLILTRTSPQKPLVLLTNSCLFRIKTWKSCEQITSFITQYPILLTLGLHSNWVWNKDYKVKSGPKDSMTLRIGNYNTPIFLWHVQYKYDNYLHSKYWW